MANLYNWQFHQVTGFDGGTANPTQRVYYIDPQNGDDGNTGAYNDPFKTIQRAIDTGISSTKIVCGSFEGPGIAGDFVGATQYGGYVAEGLVTFENSAGSSFIPTQYGNRVYLNAAYYAGNLFTVTPHVYGTFHFKNYTGPFNPYASDGIYQNCIFENIVQMYSAPVVNVAFPTFKRCLFINVNIGNTALRMGSGNHVLDNNTFINTVVNGTQWSSSTFTVRNNYFDSTSRWIPTDSGGQPNIFNWNLWEGTLTNKIRYGNVFYDDIEALQLANPTIALNDLASTTNPLLNSHNSADFTPSQASPLLKKGYDKSTIGFAEPANVIEVNSAGDFDYVNIDTTVASEITLSGSPTGTATTKALRHHEIAPKKTVVLKLNAPDLEENFGLGETMGNLAADNTPYKKDIEIRYSGASSLVNDVDDDTTYNASWLRMAIGEQPMHDTVNDVGNDDPLYDVNNAVPISAKYFKIRITLRDNEVQI